MQDDDERSSRAKRSRTTPPVKEGEEDDDVNSLILPPLRQPGQSSTLPSQLSRFVLTADEVSAANAFLAFDTEDMRRPSPPLTAVPTSLPPVPMETFAAPDSISARSAPQTNFERPHAVPLEMDPHMRRPMSAVTPYSYPIMPPHAFAPYPYGYPSAPPLAPYPYNTGYLPAPPMYATPGGAFSYPGYDPNIKPLWPGESDKDFNSYSRGFAPRSQRACAPCQKAKKRCVGQRPCERCLRLRLESNCVDSPRKSEDPQWIGNAQLPPPESAPSSSGSLPKSGPSSASSSSAATPAEPPLSTSTSTFASSSTG